MFASRPVGDDRDMESWMFPALLNGQVVLESILRTAHIPLYATLLPLSFSISDTN
jgi:hypothetical protein